MSARSFNKLVIASTPHRIIREEVKTHGPSGLDDKFVSVRVETEDELREDEKSLAVALKQQADLLKMAFKAMMGRKFPVFRTRITAGTYLGVNSVVGKYLPQFGGSTLSYSMGNLANAAEFGSLTSIFDEVFIHKAEFQLVPNNLRSGNYVASSSAAGSPGDLNSGAITWASLQHDAPLYGDSSSAWINLRGAPESKTLSSGELYNHIWTNIERYDPKAPVADGSTALSGQGWMPQGLVSTKYGGFVQCALASPSAAAASVSQYLTGQSLGQVAITFDVSFRCRS